VKNNYPWTRYWCPPDSIISLTDGGYLTNPTSFTGQIENKDLKRFDQIADTQCLVLLGEPGIGKSTSLEAEYSDSENSLLVKVISVSSSDTRFIQEVFQNERILSWKRSGEGTFELILDGLDEAMSSIHGLSELLVQELSRLPLDRLRLRIACRTAVWPQLLEGNLRSFFDEPSLAKYELAPLTREDVRLAIEAEVPGVADHFIEEVDRVEAVSLAIQPITLQMLINIYRQDQQLPATKREVFERGLQHLSQETPERRSSQPHRVAGLDRFNVASRIAAITVFSYRYAIFTGADVGKIPEGAITIPEMLTGLEDGQGMNEESVRQTLNSGLFSSRGDELLGFAHMTYAEFLAAEFLDRQQIPTQQAMCLLRHPTDPSGRIVPQLSDTAAWLATMNSGLFSALLESDPHILLASDLQSLGENSRKLLVEKLLILLDNESIDLDIWVVYKHFSKLNHPRLAEQLKSYINQVGEDKRVRSVAIDVAEACQIRDLQEDLLRVALDTNEPYWLRTNAAHAVVRIGDEEERTRLLPLAVGSGVDDPNDELKGIALKAVWPTCLSTAELIQHLSAPKKEHLFGSYWSFLGYYLPENIQLSDLPILLPWLSTLPPVHEMWSAFTKLYEKVFMKSIENISQPYILPSLAQTVIERMRIDYDIVSGYGNVDLHAALTEKPETRRSFVKVIIEEMECTSEDLDHLVYSGTPIILSDDLTWILDELKASQSDDTKRRWATVIHSLFKMYGFKERPWLPDLIIKTSQEEEILAQVFSQMLRTIDIESEEAAELKRKYEERKKWLKTVQERPKIKPPPDERIRDLLDSFESGNLDAWWRLIRELTLTPESRSYGNAHHVNLTTFPGWNSANQTTKERIIDAAKVYVENGDTKQKEWMGTTKYFPSVIAGCQALFLLALEDTGSFDEFAESVWRKWTPTVVWHSSFFASDNGEKYRDLLGRVAKKAPDEFRGTLINLIKKEDDEHGNVYSLRYFRHCMDRTTAESLLTVVREASLKAGSCGDILEELLRYGYPDAKDYAESLITSDRLDNEEGRKLATESASALIEFSEDAGWEVIWPLFHEDAEFGRNVVQSVTHYGRNDQSGILQKLSAAQLADLFRWMVVQYPYRERRREAGSVSPEESAEDFRNAIISHLRDNGTPESVAAIETLIPDFPELGWLKRTVLNARNVELRKTWIPPTPEEIIQLISDSKKRLVRSADELMEVVIETLQQIDEKLQGETPASPALWNEKKKGKELVKRWHKDENDFSDWIKIELEERLTNQGIVLNREVEINRGKGSTDIHIDVVTQQRSEGSRERVKVIIEVKGCWNPKLKTAMENQLVNQYLTASDCRHGIYLVGWFYCAICVPIGGPLKRLVQGDDYGIHAAQDYFNSQAAAFSKEGIRVQAVVLNTGLHD